jgi:hypothetical protein
MATAKAKTKETAADKVKLDIKRELSAVDLKDYDFYDNLTPEERKVFSPFILMRYTASAQGDFDIQEWYLDRTNELVNKNYSDISKNHKALQWKLYAAVGAGANCFHQYLAAGKKGKANKIEKLLCELYPATKLSEIKLMASLMDKKDITELFDKMGFDKQQRKDYE